MDLAGVGSGGDSTTSLVHCWSLRQSAVCGLGLPVPARLCLPAASFSAQCVRGGVDVLKPTKGVLQLQYSLDQSRAVAQLTPSAPELFYDSVQQQAFACPASPAAPSATAPKQAVACSAGLNDQVLLPQHTSCSRGTRPASARSPQDQTAAISMLGRQMHCGILTAACSTIDSTSVDLCLIFC